jgi:hypothetical protein
MKPLKKQSYKKTDANQREHHNYSTKVSGEKLMLGKHNACAIGWTDSRVRTLETMKYQKANNIEQTQESMITFLASQFDIGEKEMTRYDKEEENNEEDEEQDVNEDDKAKDEEEEEEEDSKVGEETDKNKDHMSSDIDDTDEKSDASV